VQRKPARPSNHGPYCHDLGGQEQTYAPDFTFNIGAQYASRSAKGDTLTPRLNYGHVSKQVGDAIRERGARRQVESRDIFNAQLAWAHDDIIATALRHQHHRPTLCRRRELRPGLRSARRVSSYSV